MAGFELSTLEPVEERIGAVEAVAARTDSRVSRMLVETETLRLRVRALEDEIRQLRRQGFN